MRGHMRQRGTNSWELRAYAGRDPITRRHVYVTRTFHGSKREAESALARVVSDVSGGGQASADTTVGELLNSWLQHARSDLSPTTARGYQWIVSNYVLPALAGVPLSKLRTAQLDRFYADLRERGGRDGAPLSAATVRQVHAIIRRALSQAVKWGWIGTNPAVLASPPRVRATVTDAPEPSQVVALIDAALAADPDLGAFLHLAATTGARRGELCGLLWRDVNLEDSVVTIRRNLVEGAGGRLVLKDTKTHASRRVAIDETTAGVLRRHKLSMAQRCLALGGSLGDDSYVFAALADPAKPWAPNEVTKRFIRLRNKAGLKDVRLHDLRHFAATRLLAAGVPLRTVSGRLGHANAATTLGVYAHFVQESDKDAATRIETILEKAR